MKKVFVPPEEENLTLWKDVKEDKYYGVILYWASGKKGFFVPSIQKPIQFYILFIQGLSQWHYYVEYKEKLSLIEMIKKVVKDGHTVFEFDSHQELFSWLAT
jgi:hypothetical protein